MSNVLLIIQLIISIILTGLILIQRSEGGALGIGGGGGGGGGFMSGRTAANSVSRWTAYLGALFIANCLLLSIVFNNENQDISIIDDTKAEQALTIDLESGETTNPLADDAITSEGEPAAVTDPSVIVSPPASSEVVIAKPETLELEAETKPEDE